MAAAKTEVKVIRVPEPHVVKVPVGGPLATRAKGGLKAAAGKLGELAKRGMTAAKKLAAEDKLMMWEFGTGAAAGYLEGQGSLSKIPHVTTLGPKGTLALAGILGGRYLKSEALRTIGRALGTIAIFEMARDKAREGGSSSAAGASGEVP